MVSRICIYGFSFGTPTPVMRERKRVYRVTPIRPLASTQTLRRDDRPPASPRLLDVTA
jgi:hypothetical protein